MPNYREYILEDESTLLIEVDETDISIAGNPREYRGGEKSASRKIGENLHLDEAMSSIKKGVLGLKKTFEDASADEVEITFGLKASGEMGNFLVAKSNMEGSFQVKLVWKKHEPLPKSPLAK
jgi:hypothetical protein